MIKKILFVISILGTLTNIYPVLSVYFGIKFSIVTFLFLLINISILLINFNGFKDLIKTKCFYTFFFFLLFVPLIIICFTKESDINFYLINIYYLSITLVSSILLQVKHRKLLRLILFSSLILNLMATILSMVAPELFLIFAEEFEKSIYTGGRGFGLFLQPNMLGHSALLIFVLSIFILRENKKLFFWSLTLSMITIILSGSRSSIIIFFSAVFVHHLTFLFKLKRPFFNYKKYFLGISFLIFSFFIFSDFKLNEVSFLKNLKDRVSSLSNTQTNSKDPSQLEREYKRVAYYDRITDKPFLGYGIGSQFTHKKKGLLKGAAHNTHLEILYQGGVIYYLFFIFFGIKLFWDSFKFGKHNESLHSYCLIIICVCFLLTFISSNVLQLRVLFVVLSPFLIPPKKFKLRINENFKS